MAALSTTYDNTLSRVLLAATTLPATADVARFEHSLDQIHWSTVRGGAAVPVVAGAASVYDYEFAPGITNHYRCSAIDTDAPSFVAAGAAATAVNAPVAPAVPAGYAEGDLLVTFAAIRNSGAGSIIRPDGWTVMLAVDNIALLGKRATASESAPTVTVAGGVAGADVIAQMACFRNLELTPAASGYQLNPSGQNIDYPVLAAVAESWRAALYLGWKQDDWTSVAPVTSGTEIGEPVATTGNDMGLVWDYQLMTTPAAVASGAFTVTGGTAAISYGATVALAAADHVTQATSSIVPAMNACWLKFVRAPYLNRSVTLVDWADTERTTRVGIFTIVGRRDAGAATDFHSPRTETVELWAEDDAEIAAVDLVLSLGGVLLLHIPPTVALKSMYAAVGSYSYRRPAHLSHQAKFTVPLTEVAQPDLAIVGNTVTWATLITNYATWADVIDDNATWADVLALQGTPADALVGH